MPAVAAPSDTSVEACAGLLVDLLAPLTRVLAEALGDEPVATRMTRAQYRALAALAERDRVCSELARVLGITPASVTATIDVLVKRAMVERVETPGDRRRVLLRCTEAGRAVLAQARTRVRARAGEILERLTPEARGALLAGLEALGPPLRAIERATPALPPETEV